MRRTYRWIIALAVLGIIGGCFSTAYSLNFIGGYRLSPLSLARELAYVGNTLQLAALALAIAVAWRVKSWPWLAAFVAIDVWSVILSASLQNSEVVWAPVLGLIIVPVVLGYEYGGTVGASLAADAPLLIGCCLALIFARRDIRRIEENQAPIPERPATYWAVVALAAVAGVGYLLIQPISQALYNASMSIVNSNPLYSEYPNTPPQVTYLRLLANMTAPASDALVILAIISGIAFIAWRGQRGWLAAVAIASLVLNVLPALLPNPYAYPPTPQPVLLHYLTQSNYGSLVTVGIPCALVMAFGIVEARRVARSVADQP